MMAICSRKLQNSFGSTSLTNSQFRLVLHDIPIGQSGGVDFMQSTPI
jgi:hypothetical protein